MIALLTTLFLIFYILIPGILFRFAASFSAVKLKSFQRTRTQEATFAVAVALLPFAITAVGVWHLPVMRHHPFSIEEGTNAERGAGLSPGGRNTAHPGFLQTDRLQRGPVSMPGGRQLLELSASRPAPPGALSKLVFPLYIRRGPGLWLPGLQIRRLAANRGEPTQSVDPSL